MKINKAKYKLTTKGTIIFFILFFTGDAIFSASIGFKNFYYIPIGAFIMFISIALIMYPCYKKLGWYGMSKERKLNV